MIWWELYRDAIFELTTLTTPLLFKRPTRYSSRSIKLRVFMAQDIKGQEAAIEEQLWAMRKGLDKYHLTSKTS